MKVAVVLSLKRGIESFAENELLELQRRGHRLLLFATKIGSAAETLRSDWELVPRGASLAIILCQVIFLMRRPLTYLRLLREALATGSLVDFLLAWGWAAKADSADVIYSIFADHKLYVGYYLKRILQKPLVCSVHGYELYDNPNPGMLPVALRACDRILSNTDYNGRLVAELCGMDAASITTCRASIDLDFWCSPPRFCILIVAYFDERKGHETLFRAVKKLNRSDIEIWCAGHYREVCDTVRERTTAANPFELAAQLGIESQVLFFGDVSRRAVRTLLQKSDVFCLPTRPDSLGICEGFPIAIMEAMAAGKTVIATRHTGIPEVVDEIIVDENDVNGLASAILRTYESRDDLVSLGSRNLGLARRHFSPSNVETLEQALRQVTSPPSSFGAGEDD